MIGKDLVKGSNKKEKTKTNEKEDDLIETQDEEVDFEEYQNQEERGREVKVRS